MSKILELKDNYGDDFIVEVEEDILPQSLYFDVYNENGNSTSSLPMIAAIQLRNFLNEFIEANNEK